MDLDNFSDMKKTEDTKYPQNRLALMRESRNLSQEDLAELLGVDKVSIGRYEACGTNKDSRDLTHGKMIEIAKALNCQPYELIADREAIISQEVAYLAENRELLNAFKNAPENIQQSIRLQLGLPTQEKKKPGNGIQNGNGTNGENHQPKRNTK